MAQQNDFDFKAFNALTERVPAGLQIFLAQQLVANALWSYEKFDNPRAVQIRLSAFDFDRLCDVGRKVRDVYAMHANAPDRLAAKAGDAYIDELAHAVAGRLGGKVGVAPRIFLKKLVADILDRIDQFPEFDPHQHYKLTIQDAELTATERQAASATSVDDITLT